MDGIMLSPNLKKLTLSNLIFDLDAHGKYLSKLLTMSSSLRELDLDTCKFVHPKCFYELV